jgi:DNA-directed RNA polymerase subunit RPC12/RpoP
MNQREQNVTFYRCKTCGSLVQAAVWWRDIFLQCPSCKKRIINRHRVLTNPLAILETSAAGTSSYIACLHGLLMANSKGVRSTDTAFTRMTRFQLQGDALPAWSTDQWLPEDVYRPFIFSWAGNEFDLVAGPAGPSSWRVDWEKADWEWLRIVRACRGLIVSMRADIVRRSSEDILQFDQTLAIRLRKLFSESHRINNVVLMFNAADLIANSSEEAENEVVGLMHTYFRTVQAVCANERIATFAVPTTTWGFGKTCEGFGRFPINSQPFNIFEPVRCALGRASLSKITSVSGTESDRGTSRNKSATNSPPETSLPYEVALSYASEDREYVEQVAVCLLNRGVRVFYDRHEAAGLWGEDLATRLSDIYGTESKYVVIFVSKHYAQKAWTLHERRHAQAQAVQGNFNRILPVRFDDTELPGLKSDIGYLDLRSLTPEMVADNVVRKLHSRAAS